MKSVRKAAVLGAGSWGTALATVVAQHAEAVSLWGRDEALCRDINERRGNTRYLPGIELDPKIRATTDIHQCVARAEVVIVGLPTKALKTVLGAMRGVIPDCVPIVSTSKGICTQTLRFPSAIIRDALDRTGKNIYILSGPSFAKETASRLPTAVTFAGSSLESAERWGRLFFTPTFRTYPSADCVGVEVAGALKNVIALASGISDGLGLGSNGRSALITRGLAEIARLGRHYGADPLTFLGLSGMGDLVLTCTGGLSRNRSLGELLAQGKSLAEGQKALGQVAEGVFTTRSVKTISERQGIPMPISSEVYAILFENKPPRQAVADLMAQPLRPEGERALAR